jgi:hypothetical protein
MKKRISERTRKRNQEDFCSSLHNQCHSKSGLGVNTLLLRFLASFPRQIVVLVLIPGCSSFAVFARYRNSSPLMILSDNLGTTVSTALSVCSLTIGAASVNPFTYAYLALPVKLLPGCLDHLWEYLVIDDFLCETINYQR